MRGTEFISVYKFPAQQCPSFGNQRILKFEVMAARDIKLRSRLSKSIHLSRDFQPRFRIFVSVQKISPLDSQNKFQMFSLFTGRHSFLQNISTNISTLGQGPHLKLREMSSLTLSTAQFLMLFFIAWQRTHSIGVPHLQSGKHRLSCRLLSKSAHTQSVEQADQQSVVHEREFKKIMRLQSHHYLCSSKLQVIGCVKSRDFRRQ